MQESTLNGPFLFDTRIVRKLHPVGDGLPDLPPIDKSYCTIDRKYWTTRVRAPKFFDMKHHAELESEWRTAKVARDYRGNVRNNDLAADSLRRSIALQSQPGLSGGLNRICPRDAVFNVPANPAAFTLTTSVHGDAGK